MKHETCLLIHPHEICDEWTELFDSAKFDVLGIHPVGGRAAGKHLETLLETVKTDNFRQFIGGIIARGGKIEYQIHAMSYLLPRGTFETHPEYFRVDETGGRTPEYNLCPSSEEALEIVSENARILAQKLYGSSEKYYFWTDDVRGSFCRCEKCKKLTPSDQALIIYNAILRGIKKYRPEAKHCFLAYQDAIDPPRNVKAEDGIFLEFAPIDRDSFLPLIDEKNAEATRPIKALIAFFGKKDSRVLEYWIDNSRFCEWKTPYKKLPFLPDVIKKDALLYKSFGFEGLSSFACYLGKEYMDIFGRPPIKEFVEILK